MEAAKTEVAPASTVEFEELFAGDCQTDAALTGPRGQTDSIEASVTEAAKLLGITERTIWRRIRQKKLDAVLVGGKTIIRLRQSDITTNATDTITDTTPIELHPVSDNESDVTDSPRGVSDTNSAIELIAELSAKLEAATYRNGYLEALLKTQSEQIQLLPDLQAQARKKELLEQEIDELRNQAQKTTELEITISERDNEIQELKDSQLRRKNWLGSLASWFKGGESQR